MADAPRPETLEEFALHRELLADAGRAEIAAQEALAALEAREAARAARRPSRESLTGQGR
jgi:hypothetical protein